MANRKLTPKIESVLRAAKIEGNKLFLVGQLDRSVYQEVDKVIKLCGGKWNRGQKCHVFDSPPEKLLFALEEGETVDEKQKFQAFFTPVAVAQRVVDLADILPHHSILEPSCGTGNLVDMMNKHVEHDHIDVCEINGKFLDILLKKRYPTVQRCYNQDFLTLTTEETGFYDRVVSNPPFTKNQWRKHIEHAYKFVKNGGKLVAITPNSLHDKKFQEFVADKKWEFEPVEAGMFKDSGTLISTNIVTIWK